MGVGERRLNEDLSRVAGLVILAVRDQGELFEANSATGRAFAASYPPSEFGQVGPA